MSAVIDEHEAGLFTRQGQALTRAAAELEAVGMYRRAAQLYDEAADVFQIAGRPDLEDGAREAAQEAGCKAAPRRA